MGRKRAFLVLLKCLKVSLFFVQNQSKYLIDSRPKWSVIKGYFFLVQGLVKVTIFNSFKTIVYKQRDFEYTEGYIEIIDRRVEIETANMDRQNNKKKDRYNEYTVEQNRLKEQIECQKKRQERRIDRNNTKKTRKKDRQKQYKEDQK